MLKITSVYHVRENPQIGHECFTTFSFMNPVPVTLTECEFIFEGSGLVRAQTAKYHDVKPEEMISFFQKFLPRLVMSANWLQLSTFENWVILLALVQFMSVRNRRFLQLNYEIPTT